MQFTLLSVRKKWSQFSMKCIACGNTNPDDGVFCVQCGKPLKDDSSTTVAISVGAASSSVTEPPVTDGEDGGRTISSDTRDDVDTRSAIVDGTINDQASHLLVEEMPSA